MKIVQKNLNCRGSLSAICQTQSQKFPDRLFEHVHIFIWDTLVCHLLCCLKSLQRVIIIKLRTCSKFISRFCVGKKDPCTHFPKRVYIHEFRFLDGECPMPPFWSMPKRCVAQMDAILFLTSEAGISEIGNFGLWFPRLSFTHKCIIGLDISMYDP